MLREVFFVTTTPPPIPSRSPSSDPPPNPLGGKTLIVDAASPTAYSLPSAAIEAAGPTDMVYVRAGLYEDKIFVADRPVYLIGEGRDAVQIVGRRSGPLYLQKVPSGRIQGLTFRYIGSDQHAAMNVLDSSCTIAQCRAMEGILSGLLLYGPDCRATVSENEVCGNRESGIFVFGGAAPRVADNRCVGNHHFGLAARDAGAQPEFVRNLCEDNWLSGIVLFGAAQAMLLENNCRNNRQWGVVLTPDCHTTPERTDLLTTNKLGENPRGPLHVTEHPLESIGR